MMRTPFWLVSVMALQLSTERKEDSRHEGWIQGLWAVLVALSSCDVEEAQLLFKVEDNQRRRFYCLANFQVSKWQESLECIYSLSMAESPSWV